MENSFKVVRVRRGNNTYWSTDELDQVCDQCYHKAGHHSVTSLAKGMGICLGAGPGYKCNCTGFTQDEFMLKVREVCSD